jgi:hypothetical protein
MSRGGLQLKDNQISLERYRPWFYAAGIYNLLWGGVNVLFPRLFFDVVGMHPLNYLPIWQVVGMFVLVYSPAYFWAARDPGRHPHLILIGLFGKLIGPIGFLWSVLTGQLPWIFGWTIVFNDLIWLPSFVGYLITVISQRRQFWSLLMGE